MVPDKVVHRRQQIRGPQKGSPHTRRWDFGSNVRVCRWKNRRGSGRRQLGKWTIGGVGRTALRSTERRHLSFVPSGDFVGSESPAHDSVSSGVCGDRRRRWEKPRFRRQIFAPSSDLQAVVRSAGSPAHDSGHRGGRFF
ncbi:hypothetical protein TIFTF001_045935 [Ficus carica]|uniref:Uncharacterized protein n=1 Tax=Ficus carica TaxID=3494 RepID=A0AA87YWM3_FICCA|nr:hypothetical protein TIFTF001_045927 [Ficus carica]GMN25267.1 hypothetical protein TIFTF001_045930 [Ficus carica]GMN25286.1 hypothetical protein TIFTF001_045932 [Ficus carica]GMN25309.1 hypothetical protein TIFTF001_045935 [Ficus carica]